MKTPKVKKREVSHRSRAARRGASPPAKNLAVKPPVEETDYKPWLHSAQNAGVSKGKKKKQLTRQQRMRQQKGLENAERNMDRMEKKVADSKHRGKKVDARRAEWDELNTKLLGKENKDEAKNSAEEVEDVNETKAGTAKEMNVTPSAAPLADLEQPLPIRLAETAMETDQPPDSIETAVESNEKDDSVDAVT